MLIYVLELREYAATCTVWNFSVDFLINFIEFSLCFHLILKESQTELPSEITKECKRPNLGIVCSKTKNVS